MSRRKECSRTYGLVNSSEKAVLARIFTGRIADADNIAEAVLFLSSERARHIVGHVLVVDGGEGL